MRLALKLDGGIEIAARLHITEQIPLAFVQQVIIQRIFLIDRHAFLDDVLAQVESFDRYFYRWSRFSLEGVVHRIARYNILLFRDADLSQPVVMLLIFLANPIQRIARLLRRDNITGVQVRDISYLTYGIKAGALQRNISDTRRLP